MSAVSAEPRAHEVVRGRTAAQMQRLSSLSASVSVEQGQCASSSARSAILRRSTVFGQDMPCAEDVIVIWCLARQVNKFWCVHEQPMATVVHPSTPVLFEAACSSIVMLCEGGTGCSGKRRSQKSLYTTSNGRLESGAKGKQHNRQHTWYRSCNKRVVEQSQRHKRAHSSPEQGFQVGCVDYFRRNVMRRSPSARCARAEARSASLGNGHDAEKVRSLTDALKRLSRPFTAHHTIATHRLSPNTPDRQTDAGSLGNASDAKCL